MRGHRYWDWASFGIAAAAGVVVGIILYATDSSVPLFGTGR